MLKFPSEVLKIATVLQSTVKRQCDNLTENPKKIRSIA